MGKKKLFVISCQDKNTTGGISMSKTPTLINFGGKYLKKKQSVLIQRKRETPHDHTY